ncbi:MAG: GIY-YIG nuclease family protein [Stellaceae bacterium]
MAYVYLLEEIPYSSNEIEHWTKIGCTKNPPEWRLNANLKRGNPRELRLAAVYEFDSENAAYIAEAVAHNHFKESAHQKEWFRLSWEQVAEWAESEAGWRRRNP